MLCKGLTMSNIVIKVENLSKQYRLGGVGTGSLKDDLKRMRYRLMGKEDPFLTIGEVNDRTTKTESDYVWALKDINFEIEKGDIVGIIGRNGAGKSTLLKILSRTTTPTTGTVKMKGRIASLLEVGTGFHGELSGRENIFLNGAILGMTKAEINKKFDQIVDFAGIEKYIDTPVKRYSSGMYVRLAFGVAAHLESEILIVDEVLAVGDAEFQKKCLGKMGELSKGEGRTVLFVSHNMSAVKELCKTGVLLKNGTITSQSKAETALNNYLADNNSDSFFHADVDPYKAGQFLSIKLYNEQGVDSNGFIGGSNPYIEISYVLNKDCSNFNVGMVLSDALGNHVYSSADTDLNPELLDKKRKGSYKVKVPLRLYNLNTGIYKLKFLIGIINNELFDEAELTFTILNNNFINTGTRPGLLIALNKWEYKY